MLVAKTCTTIPADILITNGVDVAIDGTLTMVMDNLLRNLNRIATNIMTKSASMIHPRKLTRKNNTCINILKHKSQLSVC